MRTKFVKSTAFFFHVVFLCPPNPFQSCGLYPSSCGREGVDVPIQTQIRTDSYLNAFSEGHFMAVSSIHQFYTHMHILPHGHWEAGEFPSMHPEQHNSSLAQGYRISRHWRSHAMLSLESTFKSFWVRKSKRKIKKWSGWGNSSNRGATWGNSTQITKAPHQGVQDTVQYSHRVMVEWVCERCWLHLCSQRCTGLQRIEKGETTGEGVKCWQTGSFQFKRVSALESACGSLAEPWDT